MGSTIWRIHCRSRIGRSCALQDEKAMQPANAAMARAADLGFSLRPYMNLMKLDTCEDSA